MIDSPPRAPTRRWWALACVLLLVTLLLATPVGRRPVWSSDEARFMVLAQHILDHGGWLVPELRDRPYMNKPQLYFWAIALASWPAGRVTEITAAIPSILSSVATVGSVVAIGTLCWGWTPGLLAGLILATITSFFALGNLVLADVMVTAWLTWALYCLLRARREGWPPGLLTAFYLCVGAGILSKGPMAFVALAAAAVPVVAEMGWAGLLRLRPGRGLLVLAAVLFIWVASYLGVPGRQFTGDVLAGHYGTWLFQGRLRDRLAALGVLKQFLPWAVILAGAAVWWRRAPDGDRRFVLLWTVTMWAIIGMSGIHHDRYFLPVFPGLALLTAEFLARGRERAGQRILRAVAWLTAAVTAGTALALAFAWPYAPRVMGEARAYAPGSAAEAWLVAGLLLLGALALVHGVWRGAPVRGATGLALGLAGVLLVAGVAQPARYTADVDVRGLAAVAPQHTPAGGAVQA